MRVGVIQSNYIPWRGYFDFIQQVDLFVFHDDLQYTKGDWRNRNYIKTPNGLVWLTVPVRYHKTSQLICDTEIDYSVNWQKDHLNKFNSNYAKAPYRNIATEILQVAFEFRHRTISELNICLIQAICEFLDIKTAMHRSSMYRLSNSKTERLIDLLRKTRATTYVSGPAAKAYLDESRFVDCGIQLEYKTYNYNPYPQLWGEFSGTVTILDLIANCGPDAGNYLKCNSANDIAVPPKSPAGSGLIRMDE